MSDLEQLLPGRLHTLAEDLASAGDLAGRAAAARTRHRRQRRQRIGLAAVAAAVLAVVVGVPTALGSFSRASGAHVATPGTTTTAPSSDDAATAARVQALTEARAAAAVAAAELAAQQRALGGRPIEGSAQAVVDAEEARGVDELTQAILTLNSPVRLGPTPASTACPDGAALSRGLGVHVANEPGDLTHGTDGCRWSTDVGAPTASQPEDRLTVGVAHVTQQLDRVLDEQRQLNADTRAGRCLMASVAAAVGSDGMLQRCADAGSIGWSLYLIDPTGAGTWILSAEVGDRVPGQHGGTELRAAAALATAAWPG